MRIIWKIDSIKDFFCIKKAAFASWDEAYILKKYSFLWKNAAKGILKNLMRKIVYQ